MKAFELRALLSRIDSNAEVLATTADSKGYGSFAFRLAGIGQDRTVRTGDEESPVLVLHFNAADRVWAAKGHGNPAGSDKPVEPARCKHDTPPSVRCLDCEEEDG